MGNFKEVEVDYEDTIGSDSEDLDYDPEHDEVFDDYEHIPEDVLLSNSNFSVNPYPKHDLAI